MITLQTLLFDLRIVIGDIFPFLISLAGLFFMFGLVKYILKVDDVEGRQASKNIMIWGIITITVMISVWGLVNLLAGFFDLNEQIPILPELPQ